MPSLFLKSADDKTDQIVSMMQARIFSILSCFSGDNCWSFSARGDQRIWLSAWIYAAKIVSELVCSALQRSHSVGTDGSSCPRSIREIVLDVSPVHSASCSCVIPFSFRNAWRILPPDVKSKAVTSVHSIFIMDELGVLSPRRYWLY